MTKLEAKAKFAELVILMGNDEMLPDPVDGLNPILGILVGISVVLIFLVLYT